MTTAVIKSFTRGPGLAIVKIDGRAPDIEVRVCGSDRSTMAKLLPGERIRFDFRRNRDGQVFAIDVTPI